MQNTVLVASNPFVLSLSNRGWLRRIASALLAALLLASSAVPAQSTQALRALEAPAAEPESR